MWGTQKNNSTEHSGDGIWHDRDEVIVQQVPEKLHSGEGKIFFCQMQKLLTVTQPRFVLDFTQVVELDEPGIYLLLKFMEEVMNLNGDVKLAAVAPGPAKTLEGTGVDRLFEIFDRPSDAVQSFYYLPLPECPMEATLNTSEAPANAVTVAYGAD